MNQRQHDGECILIRKMREVLTECRHQEVCLAGKVIRGNGGDLSLSFPVGVYGFSIELAQEEKTRLFREAREKGLSNLEDEDDFKPICVTSLYGTSQYPLYWGRDRSIAQRSYSHLAGDDKYKGTGLIRLNMYESLREKRIYCAVVIMKDKDTAKRVENLLKNRFPDLLKTTTME